MHEFSSNSSAWHTLTATSLRKKQIAAKLLADLFIHMMTGFLQVIFIVFHWKWVSYEQGWNLSPLQFFYFLAIMEMRTIVKTMAPAIPPIDIPRMLPWTCLDWHLSPVKKKACPDEHLQLAFPFTFTQTPSFWQGFGSHGSGRYRSWSWMGSMSWAALFCLSRTRPSMRADGTGSTGTSVLLRWIISLNSAKIIRSSFFMKLLRLSWLWDMKLFHPRATLLLQLHDSSNLPAIDGLSHIIVPLPETWSLLVVKLLLEDILFRTSGSWSSTVRVAWRFRAGHSRTASFSPLHRWKAIRA